MTRRETLKALGLGALASLLGTSPERYRWKTVGDARMNHRLGCGGDLVAHDLEVNPTLYLHSGGDAGDPDTGNYEWYRWDRAHFDFATGQEFYHLKDGGWVERTRNGWVRCEAPDRSRAVEI